MCADIANLTWNGHNRHSRSVKSSQVGAQSELTSLTPLEFTVSKSSVLRDSEIHRKIIGRVAGASSCWFAVAIRFKEMMLRQMKPSSQMLRCLVFAVALGTWVLITGVTMMISLG